MATEFVELEIWVVVDENGDYAAGTNREEAEASFDNDIGCDQSTASRRIKLTVKVPLPKPIEITGEVNVNEEPGELKAV